ncbi:hypothetical protein SLUN_25665 [Streptomyces lunaelactis]|uniref:DUF3558 domain-containing protein n=2 Tax=Streptomyces lunaelactis TaxID=1535768 RepID=A0A2R4T7G0_9ACTN|nr:hypothetical protein SLUN_25665 [Streptomyces lunaelactis]
MRQYRRSLPSVALALALSACSGSSEGTEDTPSPPQALPATAICGGVLNTAAGDALEGLTSSSTYSEIDEVGSEDVVTVAAAAAELKASPRTGKPKTRAYLCAAQAEDEHTSGSIQLSARWVELRPGDQDWASDDHWSVYDVSGAGKKTTRYPYASASSLSGRLEFHCPKGAGENEDTVLGVDMMSFRLARSGREEQAPEAIVRLMYSVAVKLATDMGCLEESRLPRTLGELNPLPLAK